MAEIFIQSSLSSSPWHLLPGIPAPIKGKLITRSTVEIEKAYFYMIRIAKTPNAGAILIIKPGEEQSMPARYFLPCHHKNNDPPVLQHMREQNTERNERMWAIPKEKKEWKIPGKSTCLNGIAQSFGLTVDELCGRAKIDPLAYVLTGRGSRKGVFTFNHWITTLEAYGFISRDDPYYKKAWLEAQDDLSVTTMAGKMFSATEYLQEHPESTLAVFKSVCLSFGMAPTTIYTMYRKHRKVQRSMSS